MDGWLFDPQFWAIIGVLLMIAEVMTFTAALGGMAVGCFAAALAVWIAPGAVGAIGWTGPLLVAAAAALIGAAGLRPIFASRTKARRVSEDINEAPYKGDKD